MTTPEITKEERRQLQAAIAAMDRAIDVICDASAPFIKAKEAIENLKCELLIASGNLEEAGFCEGCGTILFVGDKGFRFDDGPICCEECAPTWANAKENIEAGDDEEAKADFLPRFETYVADGGSPDDKLLIEL